jgi:hypothetical protein
MDMKSISWLERLFGPKQEIRCSRTGHGRAPIIIGRTGTNVFRPIGIKKSESGFEFGAVKGSKKRLIYNYQDICGAHYLCGAATGKGKSRLVAGLAMKHCRELARRGEPGVIVLDPKSETVDIILRQLAQELPTWPKGEQERLLQALVVIAPCRREAPITPLQLLRSPREEAEARAQEVSEALTQGVEADLGVLQEVVLGNVLALAIESKEDWSLVEIPHLLSDEARLCQMALQSTLAGPKAYILSGRFGHEASKRISGIQARIEKMLRIERLRLALGAPGLLDLGASFRGKITLIDLGSDFGADDATRIIGRLLFARLVSALFSSSPESLKPTLFICEEFPDLLGKGLGAKAERIFSQARSRKTGCMILFQAPAQLQNGGLLRVLQANARFTLLGQMPVAEARFFEELFLQTGKVPRKLHQGEVLPKSVFLSSPEEDAYRLEEIGRLPRGIFFFSDRDHRERTCFVQADHFNPPSWNELERSTPQELLRQIRYGSLSLPLEEAQRSYKRRLERFSTPAAAERNIAPEALPRRSRRRRGMVP